MFYGSWNVLFYDDEYVSWESMQEEENLMKNSMCIWYDDGDGLEGNMDARQN